MEPPLTETAWARPGTTPDTKKPGNTRKRVAKIVTEAFLSTGLLLGVDCKRVHRSKKFD
jgi:hypothetical protein